MSDDIIANTADQILQIKINRPEKKNALTHTMYSRMTELLTEADTDPSIRVSMLTGTLDCFTAGNDIIDFIQSPPTDEQSPVFKFLLALAEHQKPLIAAINGPAVGIGTTALLHCDLVYAGPETSLQTPFVNLGLCPEGASSLLLPQRLGHCQAAELLLLGQPVNAKKAVQLGLINEVFSEDFLAQATARARQLAAQPPAAVRLCKKMMKSRQQEIREALSSEGAAFAERLHSPEAQEAMRAFTERRSPDFSKFD